MRPAQIYDEPPTMPFVCTRCRAHGNVRGWFVDTGAEVEWEGNVYFCDACMADIVRTTPDFMTVESHREIISQYVTQVAEYRELKDRLEVIKAKWFDMTGMDLMKFFQNLEMVDEYGMGLPTTVSESVDNESTIDRDSFESEPNDSESISGDASIVPDIIFS